MKILISVALVVALFHEFHCLPIRDDDGYYSENHSFNRWGRQYGGDFNLGAHAGFKDGMASIGTTNHFGFGADGYDGVDTREVRYRISAQPAPSYSEGRYSSPYSSPYGDYAPQYGRQFSPQYHQQNSFQSGPGFENQYGSQYPEYPQRGPPRRQGGPPRRQGGPLGPPTDSPNRHQRREEEQ